MTEYFQTHAQNPVATISTLIAEIGTSDPYHAGLVSGELQAGPLLTTLSSRHFDKLVLLSKDDDVASQDSLVNELAGHFPNLKVEIITLYRTDFCHHIKTCDTFQKIVDSIREENAGAQIFVSLDSENERAHMAWMHLVYHNEAMSLIRLGNEDPTSVRVSPITILEESAATPATHNVLMEPVEPMSEDMARGMDLVGGNTSFRKAIDRAAELAKFDIPVLIAGEPGSGKTSFAGFIWRSGTRSRRPMQTTAPADLPDPLASALLFGNQGGKDERAAGLLATESNGTILIENVEKLCLPIQKALAEFLRSGAYFPVGAKTAETSHARILFTSDDASEGGPEGICPELAGILAGTTIRLPSLRERREDIPLIALHYLRRINLSLKKTRTMPKDMLRVLQQYPWGGNVRELRLAIERAALLSSGGEMRIEDLSIEVNRAQLLAQNISRQTPEIGEGFTLEGYLGDMRRKIILRALELSKGNQSEAARMLHITPQAVHQFLKFQNKATRGKTAHEAEE